MRYLIAAGIFIAWVAAVYWFVTTMQSLRRQYPQAQDDNWEDES